MVKSQILHYKKECISCGACVVVSPEFWQLDEEGLAQLKKAKEVGDHWELDVDTEEARVSNQEAADICPVQIIKLKSREGK